MDELATATVEQYLSSVLNSDVKVLSMEQLGDVKTKELKSFGYGKPYLIRCIANGHNLDMVLETMSENSFGHDHFSDRAQNLLWYHSTANRLPKHAKSLDVGIFTKDQQMISTGKAEEFFILSEFVPGYEYAVDLQRIGATGRLDPLDEQKVEALAAYLAEIHSLKQNRSALYIRRIRDLLGHGECIMGLIDNYPQDDPVVTQEILQEVERTCLQWRWKLKKMSHRLSQVHGDFHPWNILFQEGIQFRVLDRSRGEWGEPADDLTSMTINYVFHSLQKYGDLHWTYEKMFLNFWEKYLKESKDTEILNAVQPFYAWRSLVLLNPVWYPRLEQSVREKLLRFLRNILATERFAPERIKELL